MKLSEIYSKNNKFVVSYEVFPPKNDIDGEKTKILLDELCVLKNFNPSLISVTYGAGGSNQNKSLELIAKIKKQLNITPMPHFTCVSSSCTNIQTYIDAILELGVENILALRGDLPDGPCVLSDFKYACDLVNYIKTNTDLAIAVASYPEVHKEAISEQSDLEYLKHKVDMGADVAYTQLFFDNDCYFRFIDKCNKIGIKIPIIPGIMPIISFEQVLKMTQLSRICVPQKLYDILEKHKDDKNYIKQFGIDYSIEQCSNLVQHKVRGFHFYTLNKSFAVKQILENIL